MNNTRTIILDDPSDIEFFGKGKKELVLGPNSYFRNGRKEITRGIRTFLDNLNNSHLAEFLLERIRAGNRFVDLNEMPPELMAALREYHPKGAVLKVYPKVGAVAKFYNFFAGVFVGLANQSIGHDNKISISSVFRFFKNFLNRKSKWSGRGDLNSRPLAPQITEKETKP